MLEISSMALEDGDQLRAACDVLLGKTPRRSYRGHGHDDDGSTRAETETLYPGTEVSGSEFSPTKPARNLASSFNTKFARTNTMSSEDLFSQGVNKTASSDNIIDDLFPKPEENENSSTSSSSSRTAPRPSPNSQTGAGPSMVSPGVNSQATSSPIEEIFTSGAINPDSNHVESPGEQPNPNSTRPGPAAAKGSVGGAAPVIFIHPSAETAAGNTPPPVVNSGGANSKLKVEQNPTFHVESLSPAGDVASPLDVDTSVIETPPKEEGNAENAGASEIPSQQNTSATEHNPQVAKLYELIEMMRFRKEQIEELKNGLDDTQGAVELFRDTVLNFSRQRCPELIIELKQKQEKLRAEEEAFKKFKEENGGYFTGIHIPKA